MTAWFEVLVLEQLSKHYVVPELKKISMMVTYPPIKFPCYAGIDFPSQEELATF